MGAVDERDSTSADEVTARGRREWALILAAAVFSMIPRLLFATRRGFWLDEYYTLRAARLPFGEMFLERLAAGHSPLPFLYAQVFLRLFGESETALRSSSAVAGALAIVAMGGLARSLRLNAALPALLAMAVFCPYWQTIGTEFRYMMLLVAVAGFWAWAAVAFLLRDTTPRWLATMLLGALALWMHGSAFFVLSAIIGFYLWWLKEAPPAARSARRVIRLFSPVAGALFLALPLLVLLQMMGDGGGSTKLPDITKVIQNQANSVFSQGDVAQSLTGLGDSFFEYFYLAFFALGIYTFHVYTRNHEFWSARRYVFGALVGSGVGLCVYSMLSDNVQGTLRYAAPSSVPVLLLLAVTWTASGHWRRVSRYGYRSAFVIVYLVAFVLQALNQGDWHRETIGWFSRYRQPDQPVITIGKSMNLLALRYHGFPQEGSISGISSDTESVAVLLRQFRRVFGDADTGFIFQYRGTDVPVREALERLEAEGFIRRPRYFIASNQVRVIGIPRTAEAEAALEQIPGIEHPDVWFTHEPLREKSWRH